MERWADREPNKGYFVLTMHILSPYECPISGCCCFGKKRAGNKRQAQSNVLSLSNGSCHRNGELRQRAGGVHTQPGVWERESTELRGNGSNRMWVLDCFFLLGHQLGFRQFSSPLLLTLKILFAGCCRNIFINGPEQAGHGVLITFADDTKLGAVANLGEGRDLL